MAFRPHSSPDPFGATLPPGEGMEFFDILKPPTVRSGVSLIQFFPNWKNATALAAATLRESTPWVMGILTV